MAGPTHQNDPVAAMAIAGLNASQRFGRNITQQANLPQPPGAENVINTTRSGVQSASSYTPPNVLAQGSLPGLPGQGSQSLVDPLGLTQGNGPLSNLPGLRGGGNPLSNLPGLNQMLPTAGGASRAPRSSKEGNASANRKNENTGSNGSSSRRRTDSRT
jgi:hypothetical protein